MNLKVTIITLIMAVLLCGCTEEHTYRIAVSQCSSDDWRSKMNEEIEREIMFHPDAKVEIRSANDCSARQIEDIRYFIDEGFDIIIAAPNEADSVTPIIEEAYNRGIPVIIFDRDINGESFTAYVGVDNAEIGAAAATLALHHSPDDARIIEIRGLDGSTPATDRARGFAEGLRGRGNARIVASAEGLWNYDDAAKVADSMLAAHPDADIIYAHNDRMAIAASDVARRRGLRPYIIGIDAAPEIGIRAVADSVIDATFLYPTEGHRILRTALAILKGEPYERVVSVPVTSAVDASNADILLMQNESLHEETQRMVDIKNEVDDYWLRHSAQTKLFYAIIAIAVLLAVLLFMLLRTFWQHKHYQQELMHRNKLLENERDTQRSLNRQLEEATQSKLMFFTNVSHDLRTPLTLISEPVEQMASAPNLTPAQHTMMRIADRNVKILKRLINQILDFRKLENGKMTLHATEIPFGELMEQWIEAFGNLARSRSIKLTLTGGDAGFHCALDRDNIERVVFNLISNAFRYTPDNGSIMVRWSADASTLTIAVADTGVGISEEDISRIFDRFFQVDKVNPNGSGIGLALSKALVELHGGTLSVESEPGKGSCFTAAIPLRHVAENAEALPAEKIAAVPYEPDTDLPDSEAADGDERPLLLVIDDNADIRTLVSTLMGNDFRVIGAENGAKGLKLAAKYVPDLIVCDVMMPVMDGLECCRRLKNETSTSHIPVLMLTACSMDTQRVEGFDSGADGYVAKPFNHAVLAAQCRSLIQNRRRIKNLTPETTPAAATPAVVDTPEGTGARLDNDFYNRFLELFKADMHNPDLSVDALAAQLGLGRSQFYRKIKALTNYSPVELMRKLRLQQARTLLRTTDRTISEIAYEVGFSTPAYFTKCYRDAYGETPTALRENLGG